MSDIDDYARGVQVQATVNRIISAIDRGGEQAELYITDGVSTVYLRAPIPGQRRFAKGDKVGVRRYHHPELKKWVDRIVN
ncbi:MAG TPA: hypothetical protein VF597_01200 [Candidatus Saccharimonadales bacterium]|jgi:hypothetical protein